MLSDVGANTFNLPMNVFQRLNPTPNRLEAIREYVRQGGAFVMIGGYLTFQGIQGARLLPEHAHRGHPAGQPADRGRPSGEELRNPASSGDKKTIRSCGGFPRNGRRFLGYNQLTPKPGAQTVVKLGDDPMIVLGEYGRGRVCAYATDCAPHWSPLEFCKWDGYSLLWNNIVTWLTACTQ